jgi:hypothetical protein
VLEDVVELLDRQLAFLTRQQGAEFLLQLGPFLDVLRTEPRIVALIDDLEREAGEARDRFARHDDEAVAELVSLRDELMGLAPRYDDSTAEPPEDPAVSPADYLFSYANFDHIASRQGEIGFPSSRGEQKDPRAPVS